MFIDIPSLIVRGLTNTWVNVNCLSTKTTTWRISCETAYIHKFVDHVWWETLVAGSIYIQIADPQLYPAASFPNLLKSAADDFFQSGF